MSLLNQEIKDQLKDFFKNLKNTVNMHLIVDDCDTCPDTTSLLEDVSALSEQINLTVSPLDSQTAKRYGIERTPVIFFTDDEENDLRIRFNGIPAGHEFSAFITALNEVGGGGEDMPQGFIDRVATITQPINIKVFVTLGCPHCSGAVAKAHKLALMNNNVVAEMIECGTFPALADHYNVSGVPKIVINESNELVGNQPIEAFLDVIDAL
jgi:glutaredoxin-like protein